MKTEPHILVIDDENYICESCDRIFSGAGYKVDTHVNAVKGYREALMNPYDAIVLDLNLIESDGMKLLYGIRKKKPDVPVVIITGYPSEDTRRMSSTLGVIDYIIKPFEPSELLEPVRKVLTGEVASTTTRDKDLMETEVCEPGYHFYLSSWFYQMQNGVIRVGGYLPNLSNNYVKSIRLPELGSYVYRGLPLAEVTLSGGSKQVIPSAVSGKVSVVNDQLREHFYNLEKNLHRKSWIAVVEPENLERDLRANQQRSILVFTESMDEKNEFQQRILAKGYRTVVATSMENVRQSLSQGSAGVMVIDARSFGDSGPGLVREVNREFPEVKVIVFNDPDIDMERQYRKQNLFYYGVNPIMNNEMVDLLHCAFTEEKKKVQMKNPQVSSFLPDTINKISITNRYGIKVVLFAYDRILEHSGGLGYLLTKDLMDMQVPITIGHTRFHASRDAQTEIQKIEKEKEKNDRIIVLEARYQDKIPGSVSKEVQEFTNEKSALNSLVNICIQPSPGTGKVEFEVNQTLSLKELILNEMISK